MKVYQLIELLKQIPKDTEVTAWHDGDVHELHEGIDCLDFYNGTVQINIKNSFDYS
jgi:hypothetical protein